MDIIIQLIGVLGIIAGIISFQCKHHKHILCFRTLNECLFALQYLLLGAYTGMAMNVVGSVRNVIFAKQVAKGKNTKPLIFIFSVFFALFGILTWQGWKSILIIGAKIISTFAYGNKNTAVVRGLCFITSTSWLIYNVFVFSITGVLCEVFHLISIITGIIRLDLIPYAKKIKAK